LNTLLVKQKIPFIEIPFLEILKQVLLLGADVGSGEASNLLKVEHENSIGLPIISKVNTATRIWFIMVILNNSSKHLILSASKHKYLALFIHLSGLHVYVSQ
jgi:hypothetical protein